MKLVLHNYWRSSASQRVRIALNLKKLAFEYVSVNIVADENHGDAYRAKNPQMQVPTLEIIEDDGSSWRLTQSIAILEYIDERWPEPMILPLTPPLMAPTKQMDLQMAFLRARSRAMAEIINSGIQPLQNLSTTRAIKKLGGDDAAWPKPWIANGLAAYAALVADTYNQHGGYKPEMFSSGDVPTVADICLIPQLASARRFGVDYAQHEILVQIEKNCMAMPEFANAVPDVQPDAPKEK